MRDLKKAVSARLVYNPAAGYLNLQPAIPHILNILQSNGWNTELIATKERGDIISIAKDAVKQGIDVFLVAGGDGSLNEAVNGLAFSQVALGVLPTGTGNVWARQIGLPIPNRQNLEPLLESTRLLAEGCICTIDLGMAQGHYFLLWSGVGLDAQISATIEPKPPYIRRMGMIGYAIHVIKEAFIYHGVDMAINVDGKTFETCAILVVASNIDRYAVYFHLSPHARLDDGVLNITILEGRNIFETIGHVLNIITGQLSRNQKAIIMTGKRIRIETNQSCFVHVDGDPFIKTPVDITSVPGALQVLIPRKIPTSLFSNIQMD